MCRDRDLAMRRDITRRDFVNGVGVAIGGSLIAPGWLAAQERAPDVSGMQEYYPPARTGMRGSHAGSFEVAHALQSILDVTRLGEATILTRIDYKLCRHIQAAECLIHLLRIDERHVKVLLSAHDLGWRFDAIGMHPSQRPSFLHGTQSIVNSRSAQFAKQSSYGYY